VPLPKTTQTTLFRSFLPSPKKKAEVSAFDFDAANEKKSFLFALFSLAFVICFKNSFFFACVSDFVSLSRTFFCFGESSSLVQNSFCALLKRRRRRRRRRPQRKSDAVRRWGGGAFRFLSFFFLCALPPASSSFHEHHHHHHHRRRRLSTDTRWCKKETE